MRGLGRGLDALLNSHPEENENTISTISIYLIDNNADQPRKAFDDEKLKELADSIEQHGIIQPIIVQKNGDRYRIIAGERRFRAAKMAGLIEVPVIVRDMDEQEVLEVSLIENLQRENLNPIEEAAAMKMLMDEHDLTQEEVARRLGKSRPAVANSVRLLNLPEPIRNLVSDSKLLPGHCRVIATITDEDMMVEAARQAAENGWSVRETEQRVKDMLESRKQRMRQPKRTRQSNELRHAQDLLRERLGSKVAIKGDESKGKIIIDFFGKDELSRIFDTIMGTEENEDGR